MEWEILTGSENARKVDAREFTSLVPSWEESLESSTKHTGSEEGDDAEGTVIEPACEPRSTNDRNHRDGTARYIEKGGLLGGVPESLDES
jgi:hypothetical protein